MLKWRLKHNVPQNSFSFQRMPIKRISLTKEISETFPLPHLSSKTTHSSPSAFFLLTVDGIPTLQTDILVALIAFIDRHQHLQYICSLRRVHSLSHSLTLLVWVLNAWTTWLNSRWKFMYEMMKGMGVVLGRWMGHSISTSITEEAIKLSGWFEMLSASGHCQKFMRNQRQLITISVFRYVGSLKMLSGNDLKHYSSLW